MSASQKNPFPLLGLTYDPAVDAAIASCTGDEEERLQAELLECKAKLAVVSSNPDATIDAVSGVVSHFIWLKNQLGDAKRRREEKETRRSEILSIMETGAYTQACELVSNIRKRATEAMLDAPTTAKRACTEEEAFSSDGEDVHLDTARKIMEEVVSADVKAMVGAYCYSDTHKLSCPDSFSPSAGDLVGCSGCAFTLRSFAVPYHTAAVVIAAAGDEKYWIAMSSDGAKGYELKKVHGGCLAVWDL